MLVHFYRTLNVFILLCVIFSSNGVLAQSGSSHKTEHSSYTNPYNSNPNHSTSQGQTNPAGIIFTKASPKAREIVTQKTQFQLYANSSKPLYIWGDKNYSIQNEMILSSLIEYNDSDNNLQFEPNETVQTLNLQNLAQWNFSQESYNSSELIFSLYTNSFSQSPFTNTVINLTHIILAGDNFVKFSIEIVNWPWVSSDDRLALLFNFSLIGLGPQLKEMIHIENFENSNGLYVINSDNNTIGYLLNNNAAFNTQNNINLTVINQFEVYNSTNSALIIMNFPYFSTHLLQDPIIGSNGDTVSLLTQLYSFLIEKDTLILITSFLSILSLSVMVFLRKRK